MEEQGATARERLAAAYLGAWLPYGVLWSLVAVYAGETLGRAAFLGSVRFATAASLGLAIHWICGRLPWPDRGRARFALLHFAASLCFGGLLVTTSVVAFAVREGRPILEGFAGTRRYIPFELMTDTCL